MSKPVGTKRSSDGNITANIESTIIESEDPDQTNSTTELRAQFTTPLTNGGTHSSPLLVSTPPAVSKALIKSYPYLLIINKILSIATWTNEDYWINVVILLLYSLIVLYFENLVVWIGHLIVVWIITLYALLNNQIIEETNMHPTLDEVVQALTSTCIKADMLLNPITSLSLTVYDIKRLLFTTFFLTPIYLIITFFIIKPRIILLITGLYIFSYHSSYSRVIRRIIWKVKFARLIVYYLTGLDFSKAKNHSLFAAAFAKVQKTGFDITKSTTTNTSGKPVRFTYVIYENQRRWLGIGWTSNLLSYERTAWTDEFLNESSSIDTFQLPNASEDKNFNNPYESSSKINSATWRWVDKTWRLDLTNDGAITLPNSKRSKTSANPSNDEGFIYYDNTWKKPSTEDTFSKYTRRRRWIRTAELVFEQDNSTTSIIEDVSAGASTTTGASIVEIPESSTSVKSKRKSLRFADDEESGQQQQRQPEQSEVKEVEEKVEINNDVDISKKTD
ncbi:Peroxisomal membrane protein PEX30 [Spathaspora sp. JA1]|nr:Peroxisomal membrane protein PEX30 [Spathaspora sp. JA1]